MADPAQSRRSILQGLQQTRSRLQRLHSDEPQAQQRSLSSGSGGPRPTGTSQSHAPPMSRPPPSMPVQPQLPTQPQMLAPPTRTMHTSPSPTMDSSYLSQQQKVALQQVNSQSFGYYISQPSLHGNVILPVIPRFDSNGQLIV